VGFWRMFSNFANTYPHASPHPVNPEKYRLSGINPGINPGHLGLQLLIALRRPNGPILLNG
jgi:hypothetical protein